MIKRKSTSKYYFSVEGETEQWYLQWLQKTINSTNEASKRVTFICSIQKNPIKFVKTQNIISKTNMYHLCDFESNDPDHAKLFKETMDNMDAAMNIGKQINYMFGYSNLTFDLWIILHKIDLRSSIANRKMYIGSINKAYDENFENMDKYKKEKNFKRCLSKLSLTDVHNAIARSKQIMKLNQENNYNLIEYKSFNYYEENPSLMVHEVVNKILNDCGLSK